MPKTMTFGRGADFSLADAGFALGAGFALRAGFGLAFRAGFFAFVLVGAGFLAIRRSPPPTKAVRGRPLSQRRRPERTRACPGRAGRYIDRALRIDEISIGKDPPHEVNVIVEVPVGGEPIKYEMDKKAGTLVVDRFLYTAMRYPGNCGFVPHTLSDDGDPCDVLIANQRGIVPGAIIAVRPVGVLKMQDEAGGDEKIIAVPVPRLTRRYEGVLSYRDLPEITCQQIQHFFEHYKDLETGKWVKV